MSHGRSTLVCAGCGAENTDAEEPYRCASAASGDGIEHVLRRRLVLSADADVAALAAAFMDPEENPFRRYRMLLHTARLIAGTHGWDAYESLVTTLDDAIAAVDGRGFRVTPFGENAALAHAVGLAASARLFVKDDTTNVTGTHKGRHLMAILLHAEAEHRLGIQPARARARATAQGESPAEDRPFAISSCGNAALAASVLASAAGRSLDVFVPTSADRSVLERLHASGSRVVVCERTPGVVGDPCQRRFRAAIEGGALPFACQGPDNALNIDGGKTLGWEIVSSLSREGILPDRLFVQVGGGALATACAGAMDDAYRLGPLARRPRLHAVQTDGCAPLRRAYDRVVELLRARGHVPFRDAHDGVRTDDEIAGWLAENVSEDEIDAALAHAATHRSDFMWPWETEPVSAASAILDDETYDWLGVVRGMLLSGGFPVVVDDDRLLAANALAREHTTSRVSISGTAGLAGLTALVDAGVMGSSEAVCVLHTGVER